MDKPTKFLHEICGEIMAVFNIDVSPSTLCRLLKSFGMTRQKIRQIALHCCNELRGVFMAQCLFFDCEEFVFVDEMGQTIEVMYLNWLFSEGANTYNKKVACEREKN